MSRKAVPRTAAVLVAVCVLCTAAAATQIKIAETTLSLPLPPGHCELDPTVSTDAHLVSNIHAARNKTGNRLLLLSADCRDLREWRNGKRPALERRAEYQTVLAFANGPLPDAPENVLKRLCGQMQDMGTQAGSIQPKDLQQRAEQALATLRVNQMRFLGTIGEGPTACYASLLQKSQTDTGQERVEVTVFATTIVKGKVVLHYAFAPYANKGTIVEMLTRQKAMVARLQAANR